MEEKEKPKADRPTESQIFREAMKFFKGNVKLSQLKDFSMERYGVDITKRLYKVKRMIRSARDIIPCPPQAYQVHAQQQTDPVGPTTPAISTGPLNSREEKQDVQPIASDFPTAAPSSSLFNQNVPDIRHEEVVLEAPGLPVARVSSGFFTPGPSSMDANESGNLSGSARFFNPQPTQNVVVSSSTVGNAVQPEPVVFPIDTNMPFENVQRATSLSFGNVQRDTSLSFGNVQRDTLPFFGNVQRATWSSSSPSFGNVQRATPPSFGNVQRPTSPPFGNVQRATWSSFGNVQQATSPSFNDSPKPVTRSSIGPYSMPRTRNTSFGFKSGTRMVAPNPAKDRKNVVEK